MTIRQTTIFLITCLLALAGTAPAQVSLDPLPGQAFIHEETFDEAAPAGFNLSPTFVPYPHAAAWKIPGASQVVDGMLASSNKNGAAEFDVSSLFGPFGADLKNASVALYMRLWTDVKSAQPRITMGFMNFAAEEAAPDTALAGYLGIYVRNSSNPMIGWGGKTDMDNQADGTGLQKQGIALEGWYDYAVLLEGNGTSVSVSAFYKAIDAETWTAVADSTGKTTIDTEMGFDSRKVYFWTRDNANIWKIDEFAVSQAVDYLPAEYLPVDDMESYDLLSPIWYTYVDGYGYVEPAPGFHGNGSGSMVDSSPAMEYTRTNSLSLSYDNSGTFKNGFDEVVPAFYSEVTRTFGAQDWTANGVDTLSIWFRGRRANDQEPLYVTIEDIAGNKATVVNDDPAAAQKTAFTEWLVTLQDFTGVNMAGVNRLTLGVGDKAATQAGGKGTVYFDDLRLYKLFSVGPIESLVASDAGMILSINGIDVANLVLGTTTFPNPPQNAGADYLADKADDFNLKNGASGDNQPYFDTRFTVPVTTVFLIENNGNDSGYFQALDIDGKPVGPKVPFKVNVDYLKTDYRFFLNQQASGIMFTVPYPIYGIRILKPDTGSLGFDSLSTSGVPVP